MYARWPPPSTDRIFYQSLVTRSVCGDGAGGWLVVGGWVVGLFVCFLFFFLVAGANL